MVCVGVRGSEVNFKMADSDELEAIRTRRLAELQAQHGGVRYIQSAFTSADDKCVAILLT